MTSTITIDPRYQETDKMGIIHHSVYAIWYEMGRIRLMEDLGMKFHEVEALGLYLAIVSLSGHYHAPARFGKEYRLLTELVDMKHVKMVFRHRLYDDKGMLVNTGETVLAWVDERMRPISIRRSHPEIYQTFERALPVT
ncbi:MAG: acyl-CoA thioesterase [Acholeplasmataceae bacterium]|nr:acyl-CoA thioesterase [Acholeplasmataceae bacterium]